MISIIGILQKINRNKIFKMILIILGVVVVVEILALAWLALSVGSYRNYWIERANEKGQVTYLALGDSASQGIGATSPGRGYVGIIATRLEKRLNKKIRVVNLSKTGAKLSNYLNEQAPKIKDIHADFVTVEVGANDVLNFDDSKFRIEFKKVLISLPDGAYVSNMPVFNSRPGSKSRAAQASKIISEEMSNFPKLKFVDLQKQTSENQSIFGFAPDLFHPNNLSYKHWADAFWLVIDRSVDDN